MSENLVSGVLFAVAGVLAGKVFSVLMQRRNGNGKPQRSNLAAERELADITANITDLMQRVAAIETTIPRLFRDRRH